MMNTEQTIEQLIRKHGLKRVRESMSELIAHASWADWQRLDSCITNTVNKIERTKYETR